jgi:hypothetical protein
MTEEEEGAHQQRARIKLATSVLTSYGYVLVGGALWQPLISFKGFSLANLVVGFIGLGMHAAALYIAPRGEPK